MIVNSNVNYLFYNVNKYFFCKLRLLVNMLYKKLKVFFIKRKIL